MKTPPMSTTTPLIPGTFYHIYNRGVNGENLFLEDRNYRYFLEKYAHYIYPLAETYAYCLLRNHFHLLIRIREDPEHTVAPRGTPQMSRQKSASPSLQFSHLFNAYAKAINNACGRTGTLFARPFKRIAVMSERHFVHLIAYIHRNPQHHGFVADFRTWPHSSYHTFLAPGPTRLPRNVVLDWFGGRQGFVELHQRDSDGLASELTLE
jgi:putative transposase